MATAQRPPARTDVPTISWLVSQWAWAATAALAGWLVLLVATVGTLQSGAGFVEAATAAVTDPWVVLAVVLAARAMAFVLVQRRRDHAVATGELAITDDTSVGAIVAVASFSCVGLLAAAVPLPLLYSATGTYRLLTIVVAVVAVPPSYALLTYQIGEQVAADRYRRGYRVSPAVYHYCWTLPALLVVWLAMSGIGPIPVSTEPLGGFDGGVVHVESLDLLYVAAWTPPALAFGYALRRGGERVVRSLVPSR